MCQAVTRFLKQLANASLGIKKKVWKRNMRAGKVVPLCHWSLVLDALTLVSPLRTDRRVPGL